MQRLFTHAREPAKGAHSLTTHSPLLVKLLVNRGYTTEEAAARYLKPSYENHLHNPFLMHDMERAVVRVYEAIKKEEKIVVYADYDCDGIPGAVILHDLLKKIGYENFVVYIPDRHTEGYGLNRPAVEQFITDDVKLIITIDLGTTNHEDIAFAQEHGVDVIVTDHHLPHATLPAAFAVVNPKIGADTESAYPDPMLCGSGVMFKFVQAFLSKYGEEFKVGAGWEKWLLDMAGLATLSDMVPLTGENRAIASFGMQVFRKSPRPGIMQLLRKLSIDQRTIMEDDITFMVTPRLNAASRMDSPMRAFELLSERDSLKAGTVADHLTKINDERKQIVARIMKDVKAKLSERELGPIIVIGNPEWRVGVVGIVAGKIMDEYNRPVFVWGREGIGEVKPGEPLLVKGSCRSNGAVNVVDLMTAAREHFLEFGGHELAGGFSVAQDSVYHLEEKLCALFDTLKKDLVTTGAVIDATLSLSDVNDNTTTMINRLAPFGLGNPKPLFLFKNVTIKKTKQFGKEKNHLEIIVTDDMQLERTAMSFFADGDTFTKKASEGARIDLVATLEKSYFAGRTTIRLRILDIL
jgi:single-stranded-DNA-specific exonuclease